MQNGSFSPLSSVSLDAGSIPVGGLWKLRHPTAHASDDAQACRIVPDCARSVEQASDSIEYVRDAIDFVLNLAPGAPRVFDCLLKIGRRRYAARLLRVFRLALLKR